MSMDIKRRVDFQILSVGSESQRKVAMRAIADPEVEVLEVSAYTYSHVAYHVHPKPLTLIVS